MHLMERTVIVIAIVILIARAMHRLIPVAADAELCNCDCGALT